MVYSVTVDDLGNVLDVYSDSEFTADPPVDAIVHAITDEEFLSISGRGTLGGLSIVDGALVIGQSREEYKEERSNLVSRIVVTVDLMDFDGDEISQDRMSRAIVASQPGESTSWVLADNTVATVTREQLQQALRMAGDAQTAIWIPTP